MAASSCSHVSTSIPAGGHDVFLSFRGKDTRDSFTSHLYAALCNNSIKTFIDSEGLRSGDEISPSLLKTIERSKLAVVIFSENYASSPWCLEELAKILHCKKTRGQPVIPVFHNVDPSVIRHQIGSFKEAFDKHEARQQRDKVQIWRASLIEAANLSGWDSRVNRPESGLIDKIVEDILNKLEHMSSTYFHGLVGIDLRVKKVESLLCLDSQDVRSIGIWGMGGIGKTTLAKAVFDNLYTQFEGFHFLENVKEELKNHGRVELVNKFLSGVLDEKSVHMGGLSLLFTLERLRRKRILVVFDDVDELSLTQLQELANHLHLFGLGSKVLFTSRDLHVLRNFKVDEIYEVVELDQDEALQLFIINAFKNVVPTHDYLEQSKRVVDYTKGHPLAVKVLGSTLLDRREEDWVTVLNKLENFPKPSIMSILRISYDELSVEEQNIFLDVAFFFKGKNRDYALTILDSCYHFVRFSITRLVENALITISKYNEIEMHDLLQEMGFYIVREECIKDPGKRSRLLDPDDVYNMIIKKKGTDAIEGISLDLSESRNMQIESHAFATMTQLRILKFYNNEEAKVQLPSHGLEYLSSELRLLHWEGFPSKSLPLNFCGEYIVELQMPNSKVEQLWSGAQHLVNLRHLNLRLCTNLTEIPDLSNAKNIESINLHGCESLITLHSSVQYLDKLQYLSLQLCKRLRNLPTKFDSNCLQQLLLRGCSNVQKFPYLSGDNLKVLYLNEGCPFREFPPLHNCKHLKTLIVTDCADMTKFPEIPSPILRLKLSGTGIEEIPSSVQSVRMLDLSDNKYLSTLPTTICKLKFLGALYLQNCPKLEEFPEILEPMECMKWLNLSGCKNLKRLPTDFSNLKSLERLSLSNCRLIRFIPKPPRSLWYLQADNCESLETFLSREIYLRECFFVNCCRLDEKTREQIMAFAESKNQEEREFRLPLPGTEIPKWLNFRSLGSSVTVPLPFDYNRVAGITFGIVYQSTFSRKQDRRIYIRYKCYTEDNNTPLHEEFSRKYGRFHFNLPSYATRSDHLMLYHPWSYDSNLYFPTEQVLSDCSALSYEFWPEVGDNVLVKECGVHLDFAEDSGSHDEGCYSSNDVEDANTASSDTEEVLPHSKKPKLS